MHSGPSQESQHIQNAQKLKNPVEKPNGDRDSREVSSDKVHPPSKAVSPKRLKTACSGKENYEPRSRNDDGVFKVPLRPSQEHRRPLP